MRDTVSAKRKTATSFSTPQSSSSKITSSTEPTAAASSSESHVIIAYVLCACIWGTTWYAIRVCIAPGGYAIFPGCAIRFTFSAIVLALIWFFRKIKVEASEVKRLKWMGVAGLFSGVSYGLLYAAEQHISGGLAAVLSAMGPLVTATAAMMTGTEKPTKMTIIGSLIALGGVALVFHDRMQFSASQGISVAWLLFAVICNAGSNVLMKRHSLKVPAIAVNTVFFSGVSLLLWTAAAFGNQLTVPMPLPEKPTIALIYLTIFGTLVSFVAWFHLLKHVRLSTAMTLAFVTPTIAILMDAILERQILLSTETYVGMAVVMLGVASTVIFRDRGASLKSH